MLTKNQKYGLASAMACTPIEQVKSKMRANLDKDLAREGAEFVDSIAKYFHSRDGFIPDIVLKIVNCSK